MPGDKNAAQPPFQSPGAGEIANFSQHLGIPSATATAAPAASSTALSRNGLDSSPAKAAHVPLGRGPDSNALHSGSRQMSERSANGTVIMPAPQNATIARPEAPTKTSEVAAATEQPTQAYQTAQGMMQARIDKLTVEAMRREAEMAALRAQLQPDGQGTIGESPGQQEALRQDQEVQPVVRGSQSLDSNTAMQKWCQCCL